MTPVTASDYDDELGWTLAAEFDRGAREVGTDPDAQLLAGLVEHGTDEMLERMFDSLEQLCYSDDQAAARHYAAHLESLAGLLHADGQRAVLAVVDLRLGWLAATPGSWPEARLRGERAGPVLAELYPELVPDQQALLAGVADEQDQLDQARHFWASARDGYVALGQWGNAASAEAGAAGLAPEYSPVVLAQWRQAARWHLLADQPEEAAHCAEQAGWALCADWERLVDEEGQGAVELIEHTRAFVAEHGHVVLAAHVRAFGTAGEVESSASWEEACPRFDEARAEYRRVALEADELRLGMARLDMFQGMAAFSRGRYGEAEELGSRALPVLREAGTAREVELVEGLLKAIFGQTRPPESQPAMSPAPPVDDVAKAGELLAQGLHRANAGDPEGGARLLDEAARLYGSSGKAGADPAAAISAVAALLRAFAGNRPEAVAALARVRAHRDAGARRRTRSGWVMVTMAVGVLRWGLAALAGDPEETLAALRETETELLRHQAGVPAAHMAMVRGQALLGAGRSTEALRVVLPAVLALDAHRCALPDAARRSQWAARVAAGFDTACRAAAATGQPRLLAELLEVARGNAVPTPRPEDAREDVVSALGTAFFPEPSVPTPDGVAPGAAVTAGADRTALGLPARLRTPWGTVALAEQLEQARRYVDPNRAEQVVDWRAREQP